MNQCPPLAGEPGTAFFAQMQKMAGEDYEPDAEFLVRCWTVGAARAAEESMDRQRIDMERRSSPSWNFSSSLPSFSSEEFVRFQMHVSTAYAPETVAGRVASAQVLERAPDTAAVEHSEPGWDIDFDSAEPLTVERARRMLGVAACSTPAEIKGAYRQLVRMHHPDRVAGCGVNVRQAATTRMIAINEAYRILGRLAA